MTGDDSIMVNVLWRDLCKGNGMIQVKDVSQRARKSSPKALTYEALFSEFF